MITFREWEVTWDRKSGRPVLRSPIMGTVWAGAEIQSHASPTQDRHGGIYSLAPWARVWLDVAPTDPVSFEAVGAIDAHGPVLIHEDGIVRSGSARILALRLVRYSGCRHRDVYLDVSSPMYRVGGKLIHCPCKSLAEWRDLKREWLSDTDSFERLLLETYSVPRLPDGVGPWWPPVGAGPAPMP